MDPRAWLVSALTTPEAEERNRNNKDARYHPVQFDNLIEQIGKAMPDVEFFRHGHSTAIVYRKGDIHALGEIGYKNTKARGNGTPEYYVLSRRIVNARYDFKSWQHRIVSTKVLKNAVSAAATYLVPFTCEESLRDTLPVARKIVDERTAKFHNEVRTAYKNLTGDAGYISNIESDFIKDLRGHRFTTQRLNEAADAYYAAYDEWTEAKESQSRGLYYVGVIDNNGQRMVDTAKVDLTYRLKVEVFDRMPAENAAEWVKGRVAVLAMTPPLHYVPGVGLRVDDRVFYVSEER